MSFYRNWLYISIFSFCLLSSLVLESYALNNGLVLTPPMGWLDWERYRCNINCDDDPYNCIGEWLIKSIAKAMVSEGYKNAGYEYVTIDDCWPSPQRDPKTNQLVPDPHRFPSGIKALIDYVHALGLKFGIYEDVGVRTCAGYPGSEFHMQIDTRTFAEWGVDYVKLDGCNFDPAFSASAYGAFRDFLNATHRPIVYSCEWPLYARVAGTTPNYTAVSSTCNLWRTGDDVDDSWHSVSSIIDFYAGNDGGFAQVAGPGAWNDPDMLVIGNFGLSESQERAQMAFWSLWAAPLTISADIRPGQMRPFSKALLQNKNLIRINQDPLGLQGVLLLSRDPFRVWKRQLNAKDSYAFVIHHRVAGDGTSGTPLRVQVSLGTDLKLSNSAGYYVYEAFTDTLIGLYALSSSFSASIPPYDVAMIVVRPVIQRDHL